MQAICLCQFAAHGNQRGERNERCARIPRTPQGSNSKNDSNGQSESSIPTSNLDTFTRPDSGRYVIRNGRVNSGCWFATSTFAENVKTFALKVQFPPAKLGIQLPLPGNCF